MSDHDDPAGGPFFLKPLEYGQQIVPEACTYNPATALVTCPERGLFAIDPPIVGQDISCSIWIVSGVSELIQCTTVQPEETTYFEIME